MTSSVSPGVTSQSTRASFSIWRALALDSHVFLAVDSDTVLWRAVEPLVAILTIPDMVMKFMGNV
jgi:hypothetical protein